MIIVVLESASSDRKSLAEALGAAGFQVRRATHVDGAPVAQVALFAARRADDELLRSIRAIRLRRPETLVMAALDRDSLAERLACYEAGADDCLHAPLDLGETIAKLRAMQRRRSAGAAFALLPTGDAVVDRSSLELKVGELSQSLTKREAELLSLLARAEGAPVDRERVLREAWGGPAWMTNNSVDVYVGYVRRKLELLASNVTIKTVRGYGFQIALRKSRAA